MAVSSCAAQLPPFQRTHQLEAYSKATINRSITYSITNRNASHRIAPERAMATCLQLFLSSRYQAASKRLLPAGSSKLAAPGFSYHAPYLLEDARLWTPSRRSSSTDEQATRGGGQDTAVLEQILFTLPNLHTLTFANSFFMIPDGPHYFGKIST